MTHMAKTFTLVLAVFLSFYSLSGKENVELACPSPSISAIGNTEVCQGQSVRLNIDDFNPTLYNYQWFKNAASVSGQIFQDIFLTSSDESGEYTVIVTDVLDPDCISPPSNSITVQINELPETSTIPTVIGLNPGCTGDDITLLSTVSAPTGGTYRWFRNGISVLGENSSSLIINVDTQSGAYAVEILSDANCGSGESPSVDITIDALPDTPVIMTSGSSICADGTEVTLTSDLAPDGGSYVWYKDNVLIDTEESRDLVLSASEQSGDYSVQVIDGNGAMCASLTSSVERIEIFELPTPALVGADVQLCAETETALNGNVAVVGLGAWTTVAPGVVIEDPNDPQTTVSGLIPGVYEFNWQIDNGLCLGLPVTQQIEVFAEPSDAITEADKIICDLTSTSITANFPDSGMGNWILVSGTATISDPNNPNTIISDLPLNSEVVLSWSVTNGNCDVKTDELIIQVGASPSAAETSDDQQLCSVTSTTIQATAPSVGTGQWSVVSGSANIEDLSNSSTAVSNLVPGEDVVIRWTVFNDCGSNQQNIFIENELSPDIANAGADQELCGAMNTVLGGSGNGGSWVVISGTATFDNPNSPTSAVSGLSVGDNILRYVIEAEICDDTQDDVLLTVFEEPSPAVLVSNNVVFCDGETTTDIAAERPDIGIGNWSVVSGGGILTNPISPDTEITNLPLGETVLRWTISNESCNSNSADLTIFIYPTPDLERTALEICSGESIELTAIGGDTYLWSPSETLSSTTIFNPIASPLQSTTYSVDIERNGCTNATLEVAVTVNSTPELTVSSDTTIFANQSVQLFARGSDSYLWSPAESLDDAMSASPISSPSESTLYTVTGTNEFNCSSEASVNVFLSDDFEIFVPDLFSPNGDNVNDLLLVNTLGIEQLEFNIYDRKGREMFTTNDKDMGWDGTFNGSEQPMDNYIYFIIAELSSGERVSRKGSVQLIR